jgi:DNA-binding GntR family transcriptional regulator
MNNVPRHGSVVREFGPDEVRELYQVRCMIETEAAKLGIAAGRFDDDRLRKLCALHDRIKGEVRDGAFDHAAAAAGADSEFHNLIVSAGGNSLLCEWYKRILAQAKIITISSWRVLSRGAATVREHETIVEALRNQNAEEVSATIKAHLETVAATLIA